MKELQVFTNTEFGPVRTLEEDGIVLFCAKDVAGNLGYNNTADAVSRHCPYIVKRDVGVQTGTLADGDPAYQMHSMTFIPESDVYRLIMRSKLPAAQRFERWVVEEILPTIRKHGIFATGETMDAIIRDPQFGIRLLSELQAEREQRKAIEQESEQHKQIISELEPKARYCDLVLKSKTLVPVSMIAKDYGLSAIKFNLLLHELGVQYRMAETWLLYQKYADQGYAHSQTHVLDNGTTIVTTCWTQKGRLFLYQLLKEQAGVLPVIEREYGICER